MLVFRIEREKYLPSVLEGIGAARSKGSRWNSFQTHMVYTAESRALAMLEVAVHLDLSQELPSDRCFVSIEIPEEVEILRLSREDLPPLWDAKPPSRESQSIGDAFIRSKAAAVLRVPSSIVPMEYNYLINPHHPDAAKIKVIQKERLVIDERLSLK
ncbi:type II toxin-antitoxin system Res/ParT family toxin [Persicobacter diffluens]|uniref:RES domain-containing protein n=1 Tax=Persicobacter diffluens TaxID=981 RepID=A0AAN4W128_9BACT|nr:hypothetical protein PEDI_32250 [Persicobacter diffluens]